MRRGGAAALLLLLAGASGCCQCASSPAFTVRNGPALSPPPAPAGPAGPSARVLHFADFGDATCQQAAVADALAAAHGREPFDAAVVPGDLVYDCGPDASLPGAAACAFAADGNTVAPGFAPPADPAFGVHDGPLAFLGATPAYVALGNHDVATCGAGGEALARLKACLNVAHAAPQWVMPGRHYAVDVGPARLLVIDSNLVAGDYGGFTLDDEVAFVAAESAACVRAEGQPAEAAPERAGVRGAQPLRAPRQEDRPCFLVGHHPPSTAGAHRDDASQAYVARAQRLLDAGGGRIRAWLAGHDHDLQHLRTASGLDVLVSGSTSRGRWRETFSSASAGGTLLFASMRWGYGVLEIGSDGWRYRFESERSEPLYCCAAVGAGPCEPTACR